MEKYDEGRVPLSALAQARRANRCITRLYNLVLASCELNATQYVLLRAIAEANEISQHELAKGLSIASPTLSRRLSGLKKKGLVRARLGKRASRVYVVTPSGTTIVRSAAMQWRSAEERLRRALGDSKWRIFLEVCEEVCAATEHAEVMRLALHSDESQ